VCGRSDRYVEKCGLLLVHRVHLRVVVLAFSKTLRVSGDEYQLELIDTAGQDELSIVSQSHSMNLDGYVLVYSVTSEKRFTQHVHTHTHNTSSF